MEKKLETKLKKSLIYLLMIPFIGYSHNVNSSNNTIQKKDSLESVVELGIPQVVNHFDYDKLSEKVKEIIQNYNSPDTLTLDYNLPFEDLYNHTKECSGFNPDSLDYTRVNYNNMVGSITKHLERFGYDYRISVISGDGEPVTNYIFRATKDGKEYVFSLSDNYDNSKEKAKYNLELKERIGGIEKTLYEFKEKE